ncbi:MAG: hypothetical protein IJT87_13440 [Ruminiclostridium sp.]|nr:hypothetical protein [Ruminiclostridium sp.]
MGAFFQWLTETREGIFYLDALIMGGIGLLFYGANWAIFINNRIPGRKWVSMVPPLGGLLISLAFLLFIPAPWKWLALLGLTDPVFPLILYSLIVPHPAGNKPDDADNKDKDDENGENREDK